MTDEYASYEVHGSQLGYAKSMLDANGIPIQAINRQGAMYVIIIPAAYAGFDHATAPHPRRKPWWVPSRKMVVTVAMLAVVGFGAYMLLSGGIRINGVAMPTLPQVTMPTVELPNAPTVELPTVELPTLTNPLAGVNASLNETAASINRTAEAAKSAAITFAWIVGSLIAAVGLWAMRGPLSAVGHGLGGIVQSLGKVVKRG